MSSLKYLDNAPTFLAIDHSLSFRISMSRLVFAEILFRASSVMPQVKAASPATANT